jgi:hypothetical protein
MKWFLAACIVLLAARPAFAGSLDYVVGSGAHYCELVIGQKPPPSLRLVRTYRVYPEGRDFHLAYKVYRACGGRSKVAVLVEGSGIDELRIQQHGVCLRTKSGRACIGDTVHDIRRAFPVHIAEEEGLTLVADVTKDIFLTFNDDDLGSRCHDEGRVGCKRYVKSRRVKEIVLRSER